MLIRDAAIFALVVGALAFQTTALAEPRFDPRGFAVARSSPAAPNTAPNSGTFALVPGNLYFTDSSSNAILQVAPDGTLVASRSFPGYAMGLKGTAFGPDGRLYVVAVTSMGYDVLVLDALGSITRIYGGSLYVQGNLSFGKIAVDLNQQFYVAGQNSLVAYRKNTGGRRDIYQANQVFDVAILSSGNLLVASAYTVVEITNDGRRLVRQLPGSLTDVRGIAVRESSRDLFITMLGNSAAFFQFMRVHLDTGVVQQQTTFVYGDDIAFTGDDQMVVGSRTQAPGVFNLALEQLRAIGGTPLMFVSVMPEPLFLFRDEFEE
jgi:hypothetical protein